MQTLTEKVLWLLEHFKEGGLKITSKEDIENLNKQELKRVYYYPLTTPG